MSSRPNGWDSSLDSSRAFVAGGKKSEASNFLYMVQDINPKEQPKPQSEEIMDSAEVLNPGVPRGMEKEVLPETPETRAAEIAPEILPDAPVEKIGEAYVPPPAGGAPQKDFVTKEIEVTLAKGLEKTYTEMPPDLQIQFKTKGEEVAQKIRGLMSRAKEKAREILELIKSWLKLIPGISNFFLEQEAKIKTDEILKIAEEQKDVVK